MRASLSMHIAKLEAKHACALHSMLHRVLTLARSLTIPTLNHCATLQASPNKLGFSPSISPTSFYAMIGGVATVAKAERMVADHMTNASEFCVDPGPEFATHSNTTAPECPYALPTISKSDPNFWDNDYWRGRTWGPVNLLTWFGMSNPKYAENARIKAARKGLCGQSHTLLMVQCLLRSNLFCCWRMYFNCTIAIRLMPSIRAIHNQIAHLFGVPSHNIGSFNGDSTL